MSSPVKPVFNEDVAQELQREPKHAFYRDLVVSLMPSHNIKPIDSKQKPRKFPVWNKQSTGIVDHLWDIQQVAEQHVLYGTMKHNAEYYHAVLSSVSVPELRDELRTIEKTVRGDVSVLLYLLIRAHHNQFDEQNALTELEGLGVYTDVETYNAEFDRLATRVTADYLTDKARCREYVKHLDTRVAHAAHLSSRVDENWSLTFKSRTRHFGYRAHRMCWPPRPPRTTLMCLLGVLAPIHLLRRPFMHAEPLHLRMVCTCLPRI